MEALSTVDRPLARPSFVRVGAHATIAGLWLWLYRPVLGYLATIFSREDFRTNQIIVVGVLGLIALRVRREHLRPRLDAAPHLYLPAFVLACGGSALYLVVERFLDVNVLAAMLFGVASYGLLGLWLHPRSWRAGIAAALLLIGALPFGDMMQVFIGYPMRILTAALVRDGLAAAGAGSVGVDTILVFENGVSQVDMPCSGVRSLWTGALFLIAATCVEQRPLGRAWASIAFVFAGLLFIANLARVGVLVAVGQVAGWQLVAKMLHVPLGVLGFALACLAAVALLRRLPRLRDAGQPDGGARELDRPIWLAPVLIAALVAMNILYTPRPPAGPAQSHAGWAFPAELATSPLQLRPGELEWLARDGAESVERMRFAWRGITGSMLLVTSTTRRAHHYPERCFEAYGLAVERSSTYLVAADLPVRLLDLSNGKNGGQLSAAYWFQSATRTTDDYGARFWADLSFKPDRWVLVTVLFDTTQDPRTTDMRAFYTTLHGAVRHNLGGAQ
jgi:exosortase O